MKLFKPTSPGRRGMKIINYREELSGTKKPLKALVKGKKNHAGRNNQGRITVRHKGGGHKRLWRDVDFVYNKQNIPAKVQTIEYDPNRSAFIGVIAYADGEKRYMVLPQSVKVGDSIIVSEKADLTPGNRMLLSSIPVGTFIYHIELKPAGGAKLVRSAGNYAQVMSNDGRYATIKMPSGEVRKILATCYASIGEVSNPAHKLVNSGKAGRSRWLGIRPTVRGSAMNPVDHPHGGGEGKQGIGLRRGPKTRQGKLAYGVKTRRVKKYSTRLIVARRKTKREKRR
jgi:large subunit ribosomal protein L2